MKKECVLYERECVDCGECMRCDLNPLKICDNCGKCIENESEYNAVKIDKIYVDGAAADFDVDENADEAER